MLDRRCPILNSVVPPDILGTLRDTASKLPAGKNNPIRGFTTSFTNELTSPEAAVPITNARANPIIPKVFKKSKNS